VAGTGAVVRVVVVDDHPVVRDGLRGMLSAAGGLEVVGEAADGVEALAVVRRTRPDVVLMDLRMPGGDGVTATAAIRRGTAGGGTGGSGGEDGGGPPPRVLVLTTYATAREVHAVLEAGATGYVLKDAPRDELFAAVRAAARGESVLSAAAATQVVHRLRGEPEEELTERELAVLRLVARGTANRVIASTLFVSEATVKTHLGHVFDKLGVADRAAAVAAGYERGLLG
jgi:DNA-binding NarL/FixJ family response regulator